MAKVRQNLAVKDTPILELVEGVGKGRIYEVVSSKLTIGRSDENHVVIPSESVSRLHATIERRGDGSYEIQDHGSKNGVIVNGQRILNTIVEDGDLIQIGNFSFRFVRGLATADRSRSLSLRREGEKAADAPPGMSPEKKRRLLIYGGAGLVIGLFLLMGGEEEKKAPVKTDADAKSPGWEVAAPPTVPVPNASNAIAGLQDPTSGLVESEIGKLPWDDGGIVEAENHFRRGQRELVNKNYHRAIEAFQLALSLNKAHPSARYYLQSALHECEEAAKKNYELGVKYFETLQYTRAMFHFQQTINLMQHRPKDPVIAQAAKYIQLAKQKLQAAELFP